MNLTIAVFIGHFKAAAGHNFLNDVFTVNGNLNFDYPQFSAQVATSKGFDGIYMKITERTALLT